MSDNKPLVGVVMGSDSDFETIKRCLDLLESLGVPAEVRVISAHRSPDAAHEYAAEAEGRGLKLVAGRVAVELEPLAVGGSLQAVEMLVQVCDPLVRVEPHAFFKIPHHTPSSPATRKRTSLFM